MRAEYASAQAANSVSFPAPVKGWNAQDTIASMKPGDAYLLDNWIPRPGYAELRRGFAEQVVGFASSVESLLPYRAGSSEKMFAASGAAIYDTTTYGSLGASVVSGLSNARWQSVNFANDAGVWLFAVNGADTPRTYNGTSWGTSAISATVGSISMTGAVIINVMVHKRRLFLQEANSLRVWYLAADAISGTPGLLDLGPVFREGGNLVGMGVWSAAGGVDNPIAAAVFVTDQGEAAVYVGNDPSDADAWSLDGVYSIGKPLGSRAVFQTASDLVIITHDGAVPMSLAKQADRSSQKSRAVTSRIQNAFSLAAATHGEKFGWEAVLYPAGQLAIINVPVVENGMAKQFVQNTQTGAWCQFVGISAACWAYVNGNIYFGGVDGAGVKGVFRWDTGGSDNGTAIQGDAILAFDGCGMPNQMKNFTEMRPILRASSSLRHYVDVLVDYRVIEPTNIPDVGTTSSDGSWGSGLWGMATWTSSRPLQLNWTTVGGIGRVAAPRIRVISNPERSDVGDARWDEALWDEGIWSGGGQPVYPVTRCEMIGFDLMFVRGAGFG